MDSDGSIFHSFLDATNPDHSQRRAPREADDSFDITNFLTVADPDDAVSYQICFLKNLN